MIEFVEQSKIPRFNRDVIVTEKIDGTNAAVLIQEDGTIQACSKNLVLTPDKPDNHGFRAWVMANQDCLRGLGPGLHRGEWAGGGIGKRYKGADKKFFLFNVTRWESGFDHPREFRHYLDRNGVEQVARPPCCEVVPVLGVVESLGFDPRQYIELLRGNMSVAFPGFHAEGIVIFHTPSQLLFKVTCEKDAEWKGKELTTNSSGS